MIASYNSISNNFSIQQNNYLGFGNKREKLLKKILEGNKNVSSRKAANLLERLTYSSHETGSSHHVYRDAIGNSVTLAYHGRSKKLKKYQLENVANAVRDAGGLRTFA